MMTDGEGRFCLTNLPAGDHQIQVSLDGFSTRRATVRVTSVQTAPVTITLMAAIRADVVVTATRTNRRLDDVPVRTEVISRDLMTRSGARTLADAGSLEPPRARVMNSVPTAPLPAFSATDLDGQRWTAADLRGRVVLLDFWATWCAPCLAELPRLKTLRARHSRADFEILGISLDVTSRRSFVSWLNRNRIDWPQVHERAGYAANLPRLFGVDRLPRTLVIARDGTIAATDLRGERLAAVIDALADTSARVDQPLILK